MYKKKISTIAIITVLTLTTLLAAIPMVSAIDEPSLSDVWGPVTEGWPYSYVNVAGSGATPFGLVEVYWDTLATKLGEGYADSSGDYLIKNIVIPEDLAGIHDVVVYDDLSSGTNYTEYTIHPSLYLPTTKALPGDSVMMMASGFGDELAVQIYLGDITSEAGESVDLAGTPATGTFANPPVVLGTVSIAVDVNVTGTVLGNPEFNDTETVTVTDDLEGNLAGSLDDIIVATGAVNVTVTGTINYATGVITLTASGIDAATGGDAVTNIDVIVETPCAADYDWAEYLVTPSGGVETSELGSFMATIVVPAIPEIDYGDYLVTVIDTDGNQPTWFPWWWTVILGLPAAHILTVDYYVTVDPATGPTGITTTISGRIEANTDYELRFGAASIATGTSGADGSFTATYVIPAVVPEGDYTVSVVWKVTKSKTATFTVTPPPVLTKIQPTTGQPGDVITISGENFTAGADIELYLGTTLVNSTEMDDRFGPTGAAMTPNAGKFTDLEFTVPAIAPGVYVLKVVDENGASTGTAHTFIVTAAPVTTVALRGTAYYPGDTLSFNIISTEGNLGTLTVTIKDPSGATWWTVSADTTVPGPWSLTGTVTKRVLYQDQIINGNPLTLPADAPLGNWNWTVAYTPQSTGIATKATALFAVAALPSMQTVIDALNANTTTILDAITGCCDDLTALLEALDAKITAIDGTVATIDTSLGSIQTTVSSLGATITGLDGDIATIKTSVGGLTTSLASIDAVVGSMYGDVLTINTTIGTIEGTLMDMDGTLATIETDLGTVKLDVAAVQTDVEESLPVTVDMMPVWIAVILSLIAAIAAIFAVVTIRQKIAG